MSATVSDVDLLRLASIGAGIRAEWIEEEYSREGMWLKGERSPDNSQFWNPLEDDGDAFRLAVRLGIYFMIVREVGYISARIRNGVGTSFHVDIGSDVNSATRRAIVIAAAETGRGLASQPDTEKKS